MSDSVSTAQTSGMSGSYPSAEQLGVARLVHLDRVASTMDEAHELANAGTPAGTLVIADEQTRGRGRSGARWESGRGAGLWMTLVERPADASGLGVLSLRIGLVLAEVLDAFVDASCAPLRLKWPNDVYANHDGGKLAGILTEARWRDGMLDWVAIGIGVNLRVMPGTLSMAALRDDVPPAAVLQQLMPRLRAAVACTGNLTPAECAAWAAWDLAVGRRATLPISGVVAGIASSGELLVRDDDGLVRSVTSGSLVFAS